MYFFTKGVKKKQFYSWFCKFIFIIQFGLCLGNKSSVENIGGHSLKNITKELSDEFKKITEDELGVTVVQDLYSKLKFTLVVQDVEKVLLKIANNLESKLNETFDMLNYLKVEVEKFALNNGGVQSTITNCDENLNDSEVNLSQVLNKQKESAKKLKGAIKQIYLLSSQDVSSNVNVPVFSCKKQDQSILWKLYMEQSNASPRNVMLLLDHGGSLSKRQFQIVKAVGKQMISILNENDRIGLLAISDEWNSPYLSDQCLMPNQMSPVSDSHVISPANKHNKYLFNKFIDSLTKGNGITNHSLGFQQALNVIKASNLNYNETVMLLYISRGLLSSLTEAKTVLETISIMMNEIDRRVIISSCAVIDDSKPVIYETHFLRDIAEQNYTKYNIHNLNEVQKGVMITVNSSRAVGLAVARFYNVLENLNNLRDGLHISLPLYDSVAKDVSVSITQSCGLGGEFGLLGTDLFFSNLAEDVTYYSNYQDYTYSFIINMEGIVVMHPSYPRPTSIKQQQKFVDISNLEKVSNFNKVRKRLLTDVKGVYTLIDENNKIDYYWIQIKSHYVICIVVYNNGAPPVRPHKLSWFPNFTNNKLVHHRLDILPVSNLCRHLNQIATLDAGSLYLGASCFKSPFVYMHGSSNDTSSPLLAQSYMAYLKDTTRLLANPGLRDEVRDDVIVLAHILEFLRIQHLSGSRTSYVVRRYVTSPVGVLEVFPGSFISNKIEPTKRIWYLRAIEHRYTTILTPPYLDAGGAGYIVTVSYASAHAVISMDVTFGYVYKLMLKRMPFCTLKNIKCFMMDDKGYLIYHPNLIDPNGHGPMEQQHIIHKESLVANDLLNRYDFMKKTLCNNYADGTVQRFYKLNISLTDILVNGIPGEHCVKYQISAIEGTNIFVGVVNATCEVVATFCPCSMVDRLCLNCNRMEQRECECPCECPLNLNTCTHPNRTFIDNPICTAVPEQTLPMTSHSTINTNLKLCLPISCESQLNYESCLGVLGCEWCQYDVDGESFLTNPFCTSFTTCFNGILGSPTPYGNALGDHSTSDDLLGSSYSPIGPIVGSIVAAFLVSGLLFICYRSYNSSSVEHLYLTSTQENQVRMSDFNMSDDFHEVNNHRDKLLQDSKKIEPLSPYCVSTGYRRPLNAGDSDHGYSTMTPHDESEHLSFAPIEIDSLEDYCTSDTTSINTSISSKPPKGGVIDLKNKMKLLPQQTELHIPNRVIASVTVHRNMEVTQ